MGKLYNTRYWTDDGKEHVEKNLTEEELRQKTSLKNGNIVRAQSSEVIDTDSECME